MFNAFPVHNNPSPYDKSFKVLREYPLVLLVNANWRQIKALAGDGKVISTDWLRVQHKKALDRVLKSGISIGTAAFTWNLYYACEAWSAMWLSISAFTLGPRKTTRNLYPVERSEYLQSTTEYYSTQ